MESTGPIRIPVGLIEEEIAMDMKPVSRNRPGRMALPFGGLATFAGHPACTDWDKLDGADVAVLGIPIDTASSYRVGTRFGPRAIREMSMFHGFGPEGVFDCEDEVTYLTLTKSGLSMLATAT